MKTTNRSRRGKTAQKTAAERRAEAYDRVTATILSLLERGVSPWRKPWKAEGVTTSFPFNGATGRRYRGLNVWALIAEALENGYSDPRWYTFNQAKRLGVHVRKGERSTVVVLWKPTKRKVEGDDGEETQRGLYMTTYRVFNRAQIDGWADRDSEETDHERPIGESNADAVDMMALADVRHGGHRACYFPMQDRIQLPEPKAFSSTDAYWSTALHELGHWTGHPTRENRKFGARFGDDAYAVEELVAELTSALLCAVAGVDSDVENHASYVDHWHKVIKSDPSVLMTAASAAQRAADRVLDRVRATSTRAA